MHISMRNIEYIGTHKKGIVMRKPFGVDLNSFSMFVDVICVALNYITPTHIFWTTHQTFNNCNNQFHWHRVSMLCYLPFSPPLCSCCSHSMLFSHTVKTISSIEPLVFWAIIPCAWYDGWGKLPSFFMFRIDLFPFFGRQRDIVLPCHALHE